MQHNQTLTSIPARKARFDAERAVRGKIRRARFTRADASFEPRRSEVTLGVWLADPASAEYPPGVWPMRRATLHWRRHDIVVAKALNYEFQIDEDVPYALLTDVTFHPNAVEFTFGGAMRITIGIGELSVACRRTPSVRTDWGIQAWAFTLLPTSTPIVTMRGS